jgi:Bacterial Ig-like domain
MRRALLLITTAAALAAPAAASAAVTATRTAGDVATALSAPAANTAAAGSSFAPIAPIGNPAAISNGVLGGFPTNGSSFAVLSSGDATKADPANPAGESDNGGTPDPAGTRPSVYDLTTLKLDLRVPAAANCAVFSFRFLTDESPGNGSFNDGFIAELDTSDWTATSGDVSAPHNFAFDSAGNVISVNSPGSTGLTPEQATGTAFEFGTARLTAATPITAGAHSLYFSIFDQGDEVVDSAVFLDDLDLQQRPAAECVRGAQDEVPPAVTLTEPANGFATADDTPTFAGAAGEAAGDAATVSVEIRSGETVVQTLTTARTGTAWSVDAASLAPGQYSARAIQLDAAGNTGVSETRTFTITTPPVPPEPPEDTPEVDPVPVQGRSVVVSVVSGKVRIKGRNGKFRTLGDDEAIPLGSTVDATKGRVHLTSAAGGGKTQGGDFYQGAFVITQTRGAKPITQLALFGKISCATKKKKGKKATTSAKKKVRRLWGDGKGRFRTKGKHGAATVRGTKWLTEDRCNGTFVRVKRGKVAVRDFAKRKTVLVKQGHSYLAKKR